MSGTPPCASPCHVLVTGQLRTPDRLLASLRQWRQLRAQGLVARVLVVTWDDDARQSPELCRSVQDLGAELLVRPAPPIRGIGHVWPQTIALLNGLDAIGDDTAWVLKTRADLSIDPGFLRALLSAPGLLQCDAGAPFDARIWIPWFERTKPFYVADECFLGASRDLRKLCNLDESYSLLWNIGCGVTHIRRFIHPFRAHTDAFEPFLSSLTECGHFRPDRWEILARLLHDDQYLDAIAAYYAALSSWFRVSSPDGAITFRAWSSGAPQPEIGDMAHAFTPAPDVLNGGGHLFAHAEPWLHAAVTNTLTGQLAERFAVSLERARERGLPVALPSAPSPTMPSREPEVV